MNSCVGVDLHLRNTTLLHWVKGKEQSVRTVELHSAAWQSNWELLPAGSDVFLEMSRTTWWFARWVQLKTTLTNEGADGQHLRNVKLMKRRPTRKTDKHVPPSTVGLARIPV